MLKKIVPALLMSLLVACSSPEKTDYADCVNPLVGTLSTYTLSTGNTYPAIALPWGMNFWTPQTGRIGNGWTYVYTDNKIRGFKETHQPSPWIGDYGQFAIMPVTGAPLFGQDERASWFSHRSEEARPYYYSVYLADHDVTTEITPTERAAMFRFTFPETDSAFVVIDAVEGGSGIEIVSDRKIVGYSTMNRGGVPSNFRNRFVIEFDKPFTYKATFADGVLKEGVLAAEAAHAGAVIGFSTRKGEVVHARVASSFISDEQALQNLKELGDRSFDEVKADGKKIWNEALGRIEVSGENVDNMRTFYSCLYRALLFPRKLYEITADGETVHYSPYNGEVLPGYMYTDTGFWDTFRSLFPFLNLMYPTEALKMQEGLVNVYKESGFFPEWASPGHRDCMVGNNSAAVLADAYMKGLKVAEPDVMFEGLLHGSNAVHPRISSTGRLGWQYYNELGYVPYDVGINESVARTLEYAYDDWCIYTLAKALGRPDAEVQLYAQRALNYRNVFDRESSLMRGRNADGSFQSPFSPLKWGDAFTEGNSWHYTWSVFHDPQGLVDLMGGRENFVTMLDSVFNVPPLFDESYYGGVIHEIREMQVMNMGNYAHGNQPAQHMIYLYDYAGEPWKTQRWIRETMDKLYSATPDGYCGDEDNGQTSAWYVLSALGFYTVAPGTNQYIIGTPLFRNAVLHFENGNDLTIDAPDNGPDHYYIDAMTFRGKNYTKNYFEHFDLIKGGIVKVRMSDRPNLSRGTSEDDLPYSFSKE
ncbi:MAG: GH92 family glycosyl hydrolase [Bacteroidales bacterium]|nr:GH92 family glycosyl hydrolase [Bacteroidales bacterium]MBO7486921.1 GH92 family glycosyl hydrolase [Bacteroidales bacterium]